MNQKINTWAPSFIRRSHAKWQGVGESVRECHLHLKWLFRAELSPAVLKNQPAGAGDVRDADSIAGSGGSLEEGMAICSSILAWRIPMDRGAWRATVHRVAHSRA